MTIEKADRSNFSENALDTFDRFQTVTQVYRLRNGQLMTEANPFTEDWSQERKREKAAEILSGKYITFCAFEDGAAVGEIMLVPEPDKERMIVDSFHVSREHRRQGIGRKLFEEARNEAKARGARALYISACSARETVDFYLAMGCRPSPDPIPAYAEEEPWDIQMEAEL